jgi:leader peptidase (prepilin peptidase)/N-methyltransferase
VVEIALALLFAWLWLRPPERLGSALGLVLLFYFTLVVVIDLEHRLILYPVSLLGAFLCLGIGVWLYGLKTALYGGLAGFGVMLVLYFLGTWFTRWISYRRGVIIEEEALGFGDVCLSGVLGLVLGWPAIITGLVLAIFIGALVSLGYILLMVVRRNYTMFAAIPYGPFLIAGAVAILYF